MIKSYLSENKNTLASCCVLVAAPTVEQVCLLDQILSKLRGEIDITVVMDGYADSKPYWDCIVYSAVASSYHTAYKDSACLDSGNSAYEPDVGLVQTLSYFGRNAVIFYCESLVRTIYELPMNVVDSIFMMIKGHPNSEATNLSTEYEDSLFEASTTKLIKEFLEGSTRPQLSSIKKKSYQSTIPELPHTAPSSKKLPSHEVMSMKPLEKISNSSMKEYGPSYAPNQNGNSPRGGSRNPPRTPGLVDNRSSKYSLSGYPKIMERFLGRGLAQNHIEALYAEQDFLTKHKDVQIQKLLNEADPQKRAGWFGKEKPELYNALLAWVPFEVEDTESYNKLMKSTYSKDFSDRCADKKSEASYFNIWAKPKTYDVKWIKERYGRLVKSKSEYEFLRDYLSHLEQYKDYSTEFLLSKSKADETIPEEVNTLLTQVLQKEQELRKIVRENRAKYDRRPEDTAKHVGQSNKNNDTSAASNSNRAGMDGQQRSRNQNEYYDQPDSKGLNQSNPKTAMNKNGPKEEMYSGYATHGDTDSNPQEPSAIARAISEFESLPYYLRYYTSVYDKIKTRFAGLVTSDELASLCSVEYHLRGLEGKKLSDWLASSNLNYNWTTKEAFKILSELAGRQLRKTELNENQVDKKTERHVLNSQTDSEVDQVKARIFKMPEGGRYDILACDWIFEKFSGVLSDEDLLEILRNYLSLHPYKDKDINFFASLAWEQNEGLKRVGQIFKKLIGFQDEKVTAAKERADGQESAEGGSRNQRSGQGLENINKQGISDRTQAGAAVLDADKHNNELEGRHTNYSRNTETAGLNNGYCDASQSRSESEVGHQNKFQSRVEKHNPAKTLGKSKARDEFSSEKEEKPKNQKPQQNPKENKNRSRDRDYQEEESMEERNHLKNGSAGKDSNQHDESHIQETDRPYTFFNGNQEYKISNRRQEVESEDDSNDRNIAKKQDSPKYIPKRTVPRPANEILFSHEIWETKERKRFFTRRHKQQRDRGTGISKQETQNGAKDDQPKISVTQRMAEKHNIKEVEFWPNAVAQSTNLPPQVPTNTLIVGGTEQFGVLTGGLSSYYVNTQFSGQNFASSAAQSNPFEEETILLDKPSIPWNPFASSNPFDDTLPDTKSEETHFFTPSNVRTGPQHQPYGQPVHMTNNYGQSPQTVTNTAVQLPQQQHKIPPQTKTLTPATSPSPYQTQHQQSYSQHSQYSSPPQQGSLPTASHQPYATQNTGRQQSLATGGQSPYSLSQTDSLPVGQWTQPTPHTTAMLPPHTARPHPQTGATTLYHCRTPALPLTSTTNNPFLDD
jgi:hypothetical protein